MEKHEKIEVYSRDDAWKKAQELFPGDYEQDEPGSKNAGYPVYRQVGGPSWISDLGTRLELTIVDNNGNCETVNIWIEDRKIHSGGSPGDRDRPAEGAGSDQRDPAGRGSDENQYRENRD